MADAPKLYAHPFSSYCQKAIVAFYEKAVPFELRHLEHPGVAEEFADLWPIARFPLLVDRGRTIVEATAIIEHLDLAHPEPRLIPMGEAGVEVRMLDRIFDNYVMTPLQRIVGDALRPADARDAYGVTEARGMLDKAYAWLDARIGARKWAWEGGFSLADCAAAPALFYADWAHPIAEPHAALRAYRGRLLARPSMARAVDEARPYRSYFPLGAPDRD